MIDVESDSVEVGSLEAVQDKNLGWESWDSNMLYYLALSIHIRRLCRLSLGWILGDGVEFRLQAIHKFLPVP